MQSEECSQGQSSSDLRSNRSFLEKLLLGTGGVQDTLVAVLGVSQMEGEGLESRIAQNRSQNCSNPRRIYRSEMEVISLVGWWKGCTALLQRGEGWVSGAREGMLTNPVGIRRVASGRRDGQQEGFMEEA